MDSSPEFQRPFEISGHGGSMAGFGGALRPHRCLWWRITRSEFSAKTADERKDSLKEIVTAQEVPGLLAHLDGRPVGWCPVAPREVYPVSPRSPVLRPADDMLGVWSVVCFFVDRKARKMGVARALLRAAASFAKARGAAVLEAHPKDVTGARDMDVDTGTVSFYKEAGFHEVIRRSPTRPVMRLVLTAGSPSP